MTVPLADVVTSSDPSSYRDVYTVTVQAKNGLDSTWSYDSYVFYVYDENALRIWVEGEEKSTNKKSRRNLTNFKRKNEVSQNSRLTKPAEERIKTSVIQK